jgi:hypothetical protein
MSQRSTRTAWRTAYIQQRFRLLALHAFARASAYVITAFTLTLLLAASGWGQQITSVTTFQQTAISGSSQSFILEIHGTNLSPTGDSARVLIFPSNAPEPSPSMLSSATDGTILRAQFSAPASYVLQQVTLSYAASSLSYTITTAKCETGTNVSSEYAFVSQDQVKNKYGNGVAKNFHVIQLSIVNQCPVSIIVPLAGIRIVPQITVAATGQTTALTKGGGVENTPASPSGELGTGTPMVKSAIPSSTIVPYSLDHVTSVYSTDRKLTGRRAIFFNSLQAVATLGSAIEPFFGHGFTQAVSIWGGGFTNAAQTIFKDMSPEQLQNIASQSFGSAEQLGPGGSLSKFLFIPRKLKNTAAQQALMNGNVEVKFIVIPALTSSDAKSTPAKN